MVMEVPSAWFLPEWGCARDLCGATALMAEGALFHVHDAFPLVQVSVPDGAQIFTLSSDNKMTEELKKRPAPPPPVDVTKKAKRVPNPVPLRGLQWDPVELGKVLNAPEGMMAYERDVFGRMFSRLKKDPIKGINECGSECFAMMWNAFDPETLPEAFRIMAKCRADGIDEDAIIICAAGYYMEVARLLTTNEDLLLVRFGLSKAFPNEARDIMADPKAFITERFEEDDQLGPKCCNRVEKEAEGPGDDAK